MSETSTDEENSKKEPYNPQLDFSSDQFNPLLALNTPNLSIPCTSAKRYDNLSAYESAINKANNPEQYAKKSEKIKQDTETIVRRWKEHQLPVPTTKSIRYSRNILSKMEKTEGPLKLLKKCVDEKLQIKVYTRNDREVRGYCLAHIVAFDKHFNMALEGVTEVWTRRKKQKKPAFASIEPVRKSKFQRTFKFPKIGVFPDENNKKLVTCVRHVDQLVMRGEHVVLVSVVNEENTDKTEAATKSKDVKEA
ncbi:U7 snRNA-associated Sm-like protein LSm11 [Diabrotica virgifera virgifera]|uniref:U7 snRNA-associated Sm-like protein LSm11 n=1 Tax=Diabrotica virgifera virgifera TaxID=50390 RepID=A0A6P7EYW7_DIAVI|nr:U7 snRNA-associated Sm-like protein LSm11 [Diabrotica virgifera virgifera]